MNHQAADPNLMALDSDPPDCSREEAARIARDLFGLEGELEAKRGERDRNFRVRATDGRDVILKLANEAEDPGVIDLQIQALLHVEKHAPGLPVPRVVRSVNGAAVESVPLEDGRSLMVRTMTYLPGETLWDVERTPDLLRRVGQVVGRLDLALRGFFHPCADQALAWDLMRACDLAPYASMIADPDEKRIVTGVLDRFCTVARPKMSALRGQIIHNDANLGNVLADPDAGLAVTGLIDFGDMLHGPLIAELAVAGGDVVLECDDPLGAAAAFTGGFHEVYPLEPAELEVLFDGIRARLGVTMAIHAWREDRHGDMAPDLTAYEGPVRRALEQLDPVTPEEAEARFRAACNMAPVRPLPSGDIETLKARRQRLLGPDLSLSYSEPVHLVRGEGVWLYDPAGRAYLDAYNNVAHVGHCHPHVVDAVCRQVALLNTNTRYLHSTILDYTERLTSTLPDGLDVCVFVNSGSEANDIAWRMAKAFTGKSGALIMENAYHGGTDAIVALSPEEFENAPLQDHVRALESPDTYRGRFGADVAGAGVRYAADTDRAIAELVETGFGVAAVHGGFRHDQQRHSRRSAGLPGSGHRQGSCRRRRGNRGRSAIRIRQAR